MSELLSIMPLPYNADYNKDSVEHKQIASHNNAVMRNLFDEALAKNTHPDIQALSPELKNQFGIFLTAMTMHESVHQTKLTGKHNYAGRKGEGTDVTTTEIVDGVPVTFTAEGFLNFKSPEDFVDNQVNYLLRVFPKFFKARDYTQAIRGLMNDNGSVYATDLLQRGAIADQIEVDIQTYDKGKLFGNFDPNMITNQYALKIANYMGHSTMGGIMPPPRPDMIIEGEGTKYETIIVSPLGKKKDANGLTHPDAMRKRRGIIGNENGGPQMFDLKRYNILKNTDREKVKNQKENINNNLSEKYIDDILPSDVVTHGMTKEMMLNSLAAGNTFRLEGAFEEKFNDTYGVFGGIEIETDDSIFGVEAETDIFQSTQEVDDIDFKVKAEKDGVGVYGGQRKGKDYFGATIKKELEKGVRFEGGFEKDDDKKKGKIKLEVDF